MAMTNLSVQDARARQKQGATLVDVRSTREYAAGHPAGALNVPVLEHDEDTDQLLPNPDFIRVMQASVAAHTPVLISCQSGVRSVRASLMLESFGYQYVANVLGGFGGARDGSAPGWESSGLPVETTPAPGHAYQELLTKADRT